MGAKPRLEPLAASVPAHPAVWRAGRPRLLAQVLWRRNSVLSPARHLLLKTGRVINGFTAELAP